MADEGVGRVEDVAVAAVVLLELDLALHVKLAHKVGHVAHARATEGVDALVVVAHGNHAAISRTGFKAPAHIVARQLLEPGVLQLVGVLELIDQDVLEPALVVLADRVVVAQQLVAAQHQLAEVHHAFALALFLVQLVDLDLLAGVAVVGLDVGGAQAFFLAVGDEVRQLLGRKTLIVHVVLLAQALDGRKLVLRIQNLKRLRQACGLVVRAQKPVAQAVEGANPHAAHVHRQHGRQARHHFLGGLVGECDSQDAAGRGVAVLQQPGDAGGEHARLARASARQDECMACGQRDGGQLLVVEVGQEGRCSRGRTGVWGHQGLWCAR